MQSPIVNSENPLLDTQFPSEQSPFQQPQGQLNTENRRSTFEEVVIDSQASAQKTGCSYGDFVKMVAVAAALASLVVGTAGLLVYLGKLQISWAGAGAISQQMGLYVMLGGLGLSAILTILLTINACQNRARANMEQFREIAEQEGEEQLPPPMQQDVVN